MTPIRTFGCGFLVGYGGEWECLQRLPPLQHQPVLVLLFPAALHHQRLFQLLLPVHRFLPQFQLVPVPQFQRPQQVLVRQVRQFRHRQVQVHQFQPQQPVRQFRLVHRYQHQ